eukprot:26077-Rhodomonas_salina.1
MPVLELWDPPLYSTSTTNTAGRIHSTATTTRTLSCVWSPLFRVRPSNSEWACIQKWAQCIQKWFPVVVGRDFLAECQGAG